MRWEALLCPLAAGWALIRLWERLNGLITGCPFLPVYARRLSLGCVVEAWNQGRCSNESESKDH